MERRKQLKDKSQPEAPQDFALTLVGSTAICAEIALSTLTSLLPRLAIINRPGGAVFVSSGWKPREKMRPKLSVAPDGAVVG